MVYPVSFNPVVASRSANSASENSFDESTRRNFSI